MTNFIFDNFLQAGERLSKAEELMTEDASLPCGCSTPGTRMECLQCEYFKARISKVQKILTSESISKLPAPLPDNPPPRKVSRYSETLKQQVIESYLQGTPPKKIAKLFDISYATIRIWVKQAGLPKHSNIHPSKTKEYCLDLYRLGVPLKKIEEETGVAKSTLSHWATEEGLTRARSHPSSTRDIALQLYQEGKSYEDIAQLLGIKQGTVHNWIMKSDVPRQKPRYSAETKQHCLALYRQGLSPKEIEEITDVPRGRIRNWAVENGINRGHVKKHSDSVRQGCFELFQEHRCYEKVARIMGLSSSTIHRWIIEAGLATPQTVIPPYPPEKRAECLRLHAQSFSIERIASLTNVSSETIKGWFQKEDLARHAATFSSAQKNLCLSLHYDQGLTIVEISDKTAIPADVIQLWIDEARGFQRGFGYSSDVKQSCIELYQAGKTYEEITALTRVSTTTMRTWIQEFGVRLRRPRYSDEIKQQCIDLALAGRSYRQIAEITQVPQKTVSRWIRIALNNQSLSTDSSL
ncbi:MAG: helix-turn-helix domain-containing protein [Snowella sp.]|nr:helix-turn-helix domain-containing protein [Snowella sp.]